MMSILPSLDRQLAKDHGEVVAALHAVLAKLHNIEKQQEILMSKMDDEVAAIAANTAMIKKIGETVTSISEGHSTISEEIQALKDAIANNQPPDFTALDAAVADQTAAVGALGALVPTT